jgi:hypothetical protein
MAIRNATMLIFRVFGTSGWGVFGIKVFVKRGIDVASQALNQFELESPQPFMLRDILPGPGWAPYTASVRPLARDAASAPDADVEEGSYLKGALVGIGLEGVVALGVFGLWQVWHLIR